MRNNNRTRTNEWNEKKKNEANTSRMAWCVGRREKSTNGKCEKRLSYNSLCLAILCACVSVCKCAFPFKANITKQYFWWCTMKRTWNTLVFFFRWFSFVGLFYLFWFVLLLLFFSLFQFSQMIFPNVEQMVLIECCLMWIHLARFICCCAIRIVYSFVVRFFKRTATKFSHIVCFKVVVVVAVCHSSMNSCKIFMLAFVSTANCWLCGLNIKKK